MIEQKLRDYIGCVNLYHHKGVVACEDLDIGDCMEWPQTELKDQLWEVLYIRSS